MFFKALAALALVAPVLTAPLVERSSSLPPDAPYTQPNSAYESAITCPNGIKGKKGGIVFLVHGTGSKGSESWANGPYNVFLPTAGPGYDICWVDLPNRSMGDAQLSAEYVAYGISYLAAKSATKTVAIIGHSQGAGFNPQWALTFWPSKRKYVSIYIGLAPDFHGTVEGTLLCNGERAIGGCQPSVWQQSVPSRYISAQNSNHDPNSGAQALVPTLALFTRTDDVIEPETTNAIATSNLNGATIHAMQDLDVCGPTHVADHFSMIVDPAAYDLALNGLQYGPAAAGGHFDRAYCSYLVNSTFTNFTGTPALVASALADFIAFGTYPRVASEPGLQKYVCDRGYATTCGASGFPNNYVKM